MHILTVNFGPAGTSWAFMFHKREDAENAKGNEDAPFWLIEDAFGQRGIIKREAVHGFMIEDTDLSINAHIARTVHEQRVRAKATEACMADPQIKAALQRQQQGPAIISNVPRGF